MDSHKKAVGMRINEALAIADRTQKDLAVFIGVRPNVVSYWVSGERTPNTEQLIQISLFCKVSTDFLLDLTPLKAPDPDAVNFYALTGLSDDVLLSLEQAKNDAADIAVLETILSSDNFAESVTAFANIKRINDEKKDFSPENYMQEIRAINAFERLRHEVIQKLTGREYK